MRLPYCVLLLFPAPLVAASLAAADVTFAVRDRLVFDGQTINTSQNDYVNDVILGYPVNGVATTSATSTVWFHPNDLVAEIRVSLQSATQSWTDTNAGRATIHSTGTTYCNAFQSFGPSLDWGVGLYPPGASCVTQSEITGVTAGPLVSRIAWRRAQGQKAQGEYEAARHAESRVATQLRNRVSSMLYDASQFYLENILPRFQSSGLMPRQLTSRTTREWLEMTMSFADTARPDRPAMPAEADLGLQFTKRAVALGTDAMLSGRRVTDQELAAFVTTVMGAVPPDLRIQDHRPSWSLTFSEVEPMVLTWTPSATADVEFDVRMQIASIEVEDQPATEGPITVDAHFSAVGAARGPIFTRNGPVDITFATAPDPETASYVRTKFEALLGAEVAFDGLSVPGGLADSGILDRIEKLRMSTLRPDGDWLTVAWRLPE